MRPSSQTFESGQHFWRKSFADCGHLLVDGAAYFKDLRRHLLDAEESIFILGWDLSSETRLDPEIDDEDLDSLPKFLIDLLEKKSKLSIRILIWNSYPFFSSFREPIESLQKNFSHPRLHLHFFRQLPSFSSFHHKIVTIDSQIAYIGGIDLTANRLDDNRHTPRKDSGKYHGAFIPIHDAQMRIEGPAAQDLTALASEEWFRATQEKIRCSVPIKNKSSANECDFENALCFISRTRGPDREWAEIKELEKLFENLIESAQECIYIESQYLSSYSITSALSKTLRKANGPEVIIVTCKDYRGWWEKRSLGAIRNQRFKELKVSDSHGRLGIFYPLLKSFDQDITVHSKIMIIDDRYFCIGSANLTSRSMNLDSESCVAIDFSSADKNQSVARKWRLQLLGEHLDMKAHDLETRIQSSGSLLNAIKGKAFESSECKRMLVETPDIDEDFYSRLLRNRKWSDPDQALGFEVYLYKQLHQNRPHLTSFPGLTDG